MTEEHLKHTFESWVLPGGARLGSAEYWALAHGPVTWEADHLILAWIPTNKAELQTDDGYAKIRVRVWLQPGYSLEVYSSFAVPLMEEIAQCQSDVPDYFREFAQEEFSAIIRSQFRHLTTTCLRFP